jgi:hypothetical protein
LGFEPELLLSDVVDSTQSLETSLQVEVRHQSQLEEPESELQELDDELLDDDEQLPPL